MTCRCGRIKPALRMTHMCAGAAALREKLRTWILLQSRILRTGNIHIVTAIPLLLYSQIHLKLGTEPSYTTSLDMSDCKKTTTANEAASAKSQANALLVYLDLPPKATGGAHHGIFPPKKESILKFGGKYDSELSSEPSLLRR